MSDEPLAVRCRNLSKALGGREVLRGVDLDIAPGESIGLTGANGAGKTTLLRLLAALVRPSAGSVEWFGQPAARHWQSRRLIGMVAHETCLYPQLTLRENLLFAARMHALSDPADRAEHWLQRIELPRFADDLPAAVSRGMRQRVSIARALIHDPPILLLDEPFSGLDEASTAWLFDCLQEVRQQRRTLVLVLHDEQKLRQLTDRIIHLRAGRMWRIISNGSAAPAEVRIAARRAG